MQQSHDTKNDLCGTHSSTLLLDYSKAHPHFSIYTDNNERREERLFSFKGIDSTTGGDFDVIAPSLAGEEVEKSPTTQNY